MDGVNNATHFSAREGSSAQFPDQWETARSIFLPGISLLLPLGTVGNTCTLVIMRKGNLKKISTCFHLFLLALGDMGE